MVKINEPAAALSLVQQYSELTIFTYDLLQAAQLPTYITIHIANMHIDKS